MSDWETVTPQRRATDGWEDVSAPASAPGAKAAPQSIKDQLFSGVKTGFQYGGPLGAMVGAIPAGTRALDEAAYAAGGKVTDIATSMGAPVPLAAGAGFATNVGMQAIPALAGGFGLGKAAAPAMQEGAVSLMHSALKPGKDALKSGEAKLAIQTMLDEGINVSKGGLEKLRGKIDVINTEIAEAITNSTATVNKGKVAATLQDAIRKFEMQVTPKSDVAAIEKAWGEFLAHPLLAGKTDMPVQLAQSMKQGTYRSLGDKAYGELKGADIEAQKTLARGLKEGVAEGVPSIAALNKKDSDLINALSLAEHRVLIEANKNPAGISLLAKNPGAWALFMADRSSAFKSMMARLLNAGQERIPQAVAGTGIAAGQSLTQPQMTGILSNLQRDQP